MRSISADTSNISVSSSNPQSKDLNPDPERRRKTMQNVVRVSAVARALSLKKNEKLLEVVS